MIIIISVIKKLFFLYLHEKTFFFKCILRNETWSVQDANFDNIFNSLITIFILSTQENWNNIMYYSMDANSKEYVNLNIF